MMNSIDVLIYSYKGKILKDVVKSLTSSSSSKNDIKVLVIDQHPLLRGAVFDEIEGCSYSHVFWDLQNSPANYKKEFIQQSNADYILILSDNVILNNNWDEELINFVSKTGGVVSGNKKISISQDSIFYLKKSFSNSNEFELNNFVDRSLIFFSKQVSEHFKNPFYVKYNGEEGALSVDMFTSGLDIYSAPTALCSIIGESTLEELYVPFSLNHNYNQVVDLLRTGSNNFLDTSKRERSVEDFSRFHGIDIQNIKRLPFQTNDVEYDPMLLDFNKVDARRFVAKTKSIH